MQKVLLCHVCRVCRVCLEWRGKVTAVKLRIEPRQRPMMMLTEGGQG
jgi:hypothetical protein